MLVVDSNSISSFTPAVQGAPAISNNAPSGNTKNTTSNNLSDIDKELEASGLSTDTSKLNDPNTLSALNNLDNIN